MALKTDVPGTVAENTALWRGASLGNGGWFEFGEVEDGTDRVHVQLVNRFNPLFPPSFSDIGSTLSRGNVCVWSQTTEVSEKTER